MEGKGHPASVWVVVMAVVPLLSMQFKAILKESRRKLPGGDGSEPRIIDHAFRLAFVKFKRTCLRKPVRAA